MTIPRLAYYIYSSHTETNQNATMRDWWLFQWDLCGDFLPIIAVVNGFPLSNIRTFRACQSVRSDSLFIEHICLNAPQTFGCFCFVCFCLSNSMSLQSDWSIRCNLHYRTMCLNINKKLWVDNIRCVNKLRLFGPRFDIILFIVAWCQ